MIYTAKDLREDFGRRRIDALVREGRLHRVGRYYLRGDVDEAVLEAFKEGLRPTCLTAATHHGLWVPPGSDRHAYARRTQVPEGWVSHGWTSAWPEPNPVASPMLLLEHASRCLDPFDVGILADSALRQGKLHEDDVAVIRGRAPRSVARVLDRASVLAESGTETKVRLFFQLRSVPVRAQVQIPGVGRVDLLVGRRWIIECDSRAHHTGEERYEYDRKRDITGVERGYFTTRLTHRMVFGGWLETTERLCRVIRSGQHLVEPARWARTVPNR